MSSRDRLLNLVTSLDENEALICLQLLESKIAEALEGKSGKKKSKSKSPARSTPSSSKKPAASADASEGSTKKKRGRPPKNKPAAEEGHSTPVKKDKSSAASTPVTSAKKKSKTAESSVSSSKKKTPAAAASGKKKVVKEVSSEEVADGELPSWDWVKHGALVRVTQLSPSGEWLRVVARKSPTGRSREHEVLLTTDRVDQVDEAYWGVIAAYFDHNKEKLPSTLKDTRFASWFRSRA